jgi:hypothetical protein
MQRGCKTRLKQKKYRNNLEFIKKTFIFAGENKDEISKVYGNESL